MLRFFFGPFGLSEGGGHERCVGRFVQKHFTEVDFFGQLAFTSWQSFSVKSEYSKLSIGPYFSINRHVDVVWDADDLTRRLQPPYKLVGENFLSEGGQTALIVLPFEGEI